MSVVRNEIRIYILTGNCWLNQDYDSTHFLCLTRKNPETDKYGFVKDHSCNTFLYIIINTLALIISIAHISKWTAPSVMSYVISLKDKHWEGVNVKVMVNATFNIISLSWLPILLVEENEYPEKANDLSQVIDKLYYILLYEWVLNSQLYWW